MNWDEFIENCTKEYVGHLNGVKKSLDQLNADKNMTLGSHTEETAPENVKDKIERDKKSWQKEWGIYGSRVQDLVQKHQKQVYDHIRKQEIVNDLTVTEQAKEKSKQNGRGR